MATTVTSDAEFKTYVQGLTAFTTDTVYMNDNSKYWTFTRENNGKTNAMCVNGDNIEIWIYDGTDWIINNIPLVLNNLTSTSTTSALSANQGKVLNENLSKLSKRLIDTNRNTIDEVISAVTQTGSTNISVIPTNSSLCNTLGGGNQSGIFLMKYFPSDNVIRYVGFGSNGTLGAINPSTKAVTIEKRLDTTVHRRTSGTYSNVSLVGVTGYVSNSGKDMYLYIPMILDSAVIGTITVSSLKLSMRIPTGGYVISQNADIMSYFNNAWTSSAQGVIVVYATKSDGWGITNNVPLVGNIEMSYTIS